MNKSNLFFWCVCFFWVLDVCDATALAGEVNPPLGAKPFVIPLHPTNTTFHTGFQRPHFRDPATLHQEETRRKQIAKTLSTRWWQTHLALDHTHIPHRSQADTSVTSGSNNSGTSAKQSPNADEGVQWKPLLAQSLTFLWIQHTFRFLTEPGTRAEMRGPFFADWFTSVRNTRGWRDGDEFLVNYIGHPMQGSVTNYIYVHNDPKNRELEAGFNKAYFKSRMKAMLFSTVYSTQFELGLLGEAALGNVGRVPTPKSQHPMAYVDLVVTPTLGTVWMMSEDALDRLLIKRLENHVENRFVRLMVRGFLNPSRSFANVLRGRYPWHRDGRRL
jgi:hypothetical protein